MDEWCIAWPIGHVSEVNPSSYSQKSILVVTPGSQPAPEENALLTYTNVSKELDLAVMQ